MRHRTRISILSSSIVAVTLLGARSVRAQRAALNADSLLHRGLIERAESVYYADARMRPRDPVARWNLGTYLIERGAQRIGMTLVEEAQQFGFDKGGAGRTLAPVYLDLGEYGKLLTLPVSPLNAGERQRARYLEAHPTATQSPDSSTGAAFTPAKSGNASFGTITLRINGHPMEATIVNSGAELVLSDAVANVAGTAVHRFGGAGAGPVPAVIDSIGIARLTVTNVPVTVSALPSGSDARISLAFLARYAPTFDPRTRVLTLRLSGHAPRTALSGNAFSTLVVNDRYSVLRAGRWSSVDDPAIM
ncbi:MAG TPA: hypothetical protein VGM50_04625, partial [Gemmatimonadaceae bacterium]